MTTKDLEELSVMELKKLAIKSNLLEAYIDSNDKTPSWDGDIYLYKSDKSKGKSDLDRKISIQLKSTGVSKFSVNEVSYSMSVDDLENYYNNNGTIVFLAEVIDPDNIKMFYNSLLPIDLKMILSSLKKENQKNKTIKLKELRCDLGGLEKIVKDFDRNRIKQSKPLVEKQISIGNLSNESEITIDFNELNSSSFDNEYYAYATIGEFNIEVPLIEKFKLSTISTKVKGRISVGEKIHYNNYNVIKQKNKTLIEIGDKVILDLDARKIKVTDPETTIDNYLKTLYLLKDISEYKYICINSISIGVNDLFKEKEVKNRIKMIEDIRETLLKLGINLKTFTLKNMNEKSYINLTSLVDSVLRNKTIKLEKTIKQPSISKMDIGGKYILVMIVPVGSEEYRIVDIFSKEYENTFYNQQDDNTNIYISPYVILRDDDMNCINFNFNRAQSNIIKYGCRKEYMEMVNLYVLNLLKNYDKYKENNYLNLALYLSEWLSDNYKEDDIYSINKYQAIKRKRKLNKEEVEKILKIRSLNKDEQIQCCANILIDNKIEAEINLDNMSEEIKEQFKKFPIYSLLKVNEKL